MDAKNNFRDDFWSFRLFCSTKAAFKLKHKYLFSKVENVAKKLEKTTLKKTSHKKTFQH